MRHLACAGLIALAIGIALGRHRSGEVRAKTFEPAGSGAVRLHVPALSPASGPDADCTAELAIMSLGPVPSQAIVARFAPTTDAECGTCDGPTSIACTGLLRPGGAWRLILAPGAGGGADGAEIEPLGSAVVFSVSADPLERIVPGGGPAPAASVLCAALHSAIAAAPSPSARCAAWSAFEAAWAAGGAYGGVPLDRALGAPIGGSVVAACPEGIAAMPAAAANADEGGAAVLHRLPAVEPGGTIVVQNAGSECVSVELSSRTTGSCAGPARCMTFDVVPGHARTIPASACGPSGSGAGGGTLRELTIAAGGPVAVALARRDGQGAELSGGEGQTAEALAAPIVFDPEQGWTSTVDVTTFSEPPAEVLVTIDFLDAAGGLATRIERRVCAGGSISVPRPATSALPGLDVGGARVRARRADGGAGTARVAASVRLVRPADSGPGEEPGAGGASARYGLMPLDPAGVGLLALPALNKRASGDEGSSAIGVANTAAAGVSSEYAMLLFDPSGLIDTTCGTLEAGAVEYIDLDRWATIPAGFRGSAIISATRWRHAGPADPRDPAPVRLSAVAARWSGPAGAGEGDRLAIVPAIALPLGSESAVALAGALPAAPCEPGVPIPGTTATSTPRSSPSPSPTPPRRPTSIPSPTPPPDAPHEIWLPLAQRAHVLREPTATSEPSATATPTETVDPGGTPSPIVTPGPSATVEPGRTAGPTATASPPATVAPVATTTRARAVGSPATRPRRPR